MILVRMNEFDVVAALNEELAVQHYEKFRGKGRHLIINLRYYGLVDPENLVDFAMPWHTETQEMTFKEAFDQGKFKLPHVFTNTLRRI